MFKVPTLAAISGLVLIAYAAIVTIVLEIVGLDRGFEWLLKVIGLEVTDRIFCMMINLY